MIDDRRRAAACRLSLFLVAAVGGVLVPAPASAVATTLPAGFVEETVAAGMSVPTAMAAAPDGRIFVTEKSGRVRVVTAAGTLRSVPLLDLRDSVNSYSDRGLLGIAVDRDFATNGHLYLLYSYELNPLMPDGSGAMVSRLTRVTVNPDDTVANPDDPETPILGKDVSGPCLEPDNARDCIPSDHYWHSIGTVRVDPVDGTLWVGSGDAHAHAVDAHSYRTYDEHSYAGKIIHVDRNGRGLPDHPFCPTDTNLDHTCTKIYAKGFRNPFRFSLRPGKGPVVGDVGASDRDELDLVEPGENYGWPCYEGDLRTPLYDQEPRCQQEYAKEGTSAAASPPAWSYDHGAGASIVAGPAYSGSGYPASYGGDVFVGDYVQGWVKRLDVSADDRVTAVHEFGTGWPTGVDIQALPGSGDIAYVDLGWGGMPPAIRRFRYTGSGNRSPTATAAATPTAGPAPLAVAFTGSGSVDPDGDDLSYAWSFGDGASSSEADPTHTYTGGGTYTATLTVDDGAETDTDSVQITAGNVAPVARIDAPTDEATFQAGRAVALRGGATDAEDGPLSGQALQWRIVLHHGTHVHPLSTVSGAVTSFTPLTDHDLNSYYEITLTATDSTGLEAVETIEVRPETATLNMASSPPGAPIDYADDPTAPAPFAATAAVGFRPRVSAAETFEVGRVTYRFSGWSDGGAIGHQIDVPAGDTTLTATYVPENADRLVFTPEADAWVDADDPNAGADPASGLRLDGAPSVTRAFLRFPVTAIAGRTVRNVWLRMYQRDASRSGGRVHSMSASAWTESVTWNTQPAIDGVRLGAFGVVSAGNWYEAGLVPATVSGDGPLSLALDTANGDASVWASREDAEQPQLVVDLAKEVDAPLPPVDPPLPPPQPPVNPPPVNLPPPGGGTPQPPSEEPTTPAHPPTETPPTPPAAPPSDTTSPDARDAGGPPPPDRTDGDAGDEGDELEPTPPRGDRGRRPPARCRVGRIRTSVDRRKLVIRLRCSAARVTRIRARLRRRGRTFASGRGAGRKGRRRLVLRSGEPLRAGRYRLTLRMGSAGRHTVGVWLR